MSQRSLTRSITTDVLKHIYSLLKIHYRQISPVYLFRAITREVLIANSVNQRDNNL